MWVFRPFVIAQLLLFAVLSICFGAWIHDRQKRDAYWHGRSELQRCVSFWDENFRRTSDNLRIASKMHNGADDGEILSNLQFLSRHNPYIKHIDVISGASYGDGVNKPPDQNERWYLFGEHVFYSYKVKGSTMLMGIPIQMIVDDFAKHNAVVLDSKSRIIKPEQHNRWHLASKDKLVGDYEAFHMSEVPWHAAWIHGYHATPPHVFAIYAAVLMLISLTVLYLYYVLPAWRLTKGYRQKSGSWSAVLGRMHGFYKVRGFHGRKRLRDILHHYRINNLHKMPDVMHDVKNSLQIISGCSEISQATICNMKNPNHGAENLEFLDRLENIASKTTCHVDRMQKMICSILNRDLGESPPSRSSDICSLLHEEVDAWIVSSPEAVNLDMDIEQRDIVVNLPAESMRGILSNILKNAYDAVISRKKVSGDSYVPSLKVKLRRFDDIARIEITDNGIGIPSSQLSRIFDRDFSTKINGSGVGLSNAKNIVERYSGKICVDIDSGWTKFILEISCVTREAV